MVFASFLVKIVYIHPKNLGYYEDHEIFSLFIGYISYILTDNNENGKLFTHYDHHIEGKYKIIFSQRLYYVKDLNRILKEINPDVVVTKEIFSLVSLQVHKIKRKLNFKHVIIAYENTHFNNSLWGIFPITRVISLMNRDSIFIAVTDDVAKVLLSIGVKSQNIIKSFTGLFPVSFPVTSFYHTDRQDEFKVLYIGNMFPNKGIKTLVNAFRMLKNSGYYKINLYMAGRGELSEYVELVSKELNNLHYLGYITEEKKNELLTNSSLFVYPSEDIYFLKIFHRWKEQTATSVMEAMRYGLPTVVSDSGSLPEIIGRHDMVFHQGNAEELRDRILMIYNDKKLWDNVSSFNKKRFIEKFDINKNAKSINDYLNSIQ